MSTTAGKNKQAPKPQATKTQDNDPRPVDLIPAEHQALGPSGVWGADDTLDTREAVTAPDGA